MAATRRSTILAHSTRRRRRRSRTALANVASFCNLTFTETAAAGAILRYAEADSINYTDDATVARTPACTSREHRHRRGEPARTRSWASAVSADFAQGDSWFFTGGYTNPVLGSFQDAAGIMHETGHNLGLKHGHVTQNGHGVISRRCRPIMIHTSTR